MSVYVACILLLAGAAQPDHEVVRNGLVTRLEGLQQIVVKYDLEWIPTPSKRSLERDGTDIAGGATVHVIRDPVKRHEQFWYLDGRMRHEARVSIETQEYLRRTNSHYRPRTEYIDVYTREKYESLSYLKSGMVPYKGRIDDPAMQLAVDREIELGLGLKSFRSAKWLTASDFDSAEIETTSSGHVVVSRDIAGCLHKWTFDTNLGYALESYELIVGNMLAWRLRNSDFKNIDGFMLPMRMESKGFVKEDGDVINVDTKRISVNEYSLNHPENTPDKYNIVWPAGATVYDNRIGVKFAADDAGKLHPALRSTKEVLDNLAKPLEEWQNAGDANTSSSTPEAPENAAENARQDQNESPLYGEVPPIAGTADADAGAGRTLTFIALALFLACAVSVVVYNAKRRSKATG